MKKSGARLREVGTTNRTRLSDYEQAINESTRLILRVHPSNYRIIGFTERPSVAQIANLARKAGVSSYEDLGSGCLLDMTGYGVSDEPVVSDSLKAGISIVSFSGDKLLGGPQAGLIAGSCELVDRVKKNPLMRALRVDKMTYAAIEATLRIYERGAAADEIPVIRAIADSKENIKTRAEGVMKRIAVLSQDLKPALADGVSVIGGGSAPGVELPTVLITLEQAGLSAHSIQERLRAFSTPVVTRTEDDRVVIDLRTVRPDEEDILVEAVRGLLAGKPETAASADA
jgi:L-seryl-tRNA(Ser) seleniumtransferase